MTKLYNRPMNFFEKIQVGWWWVGEIFDEWCYSMGGQPGPYYDMSFEMEDEE